MLEFVVVQALDFAIKQALRKAYWKCQWTTEGGVRVVTTGGPKNVEAVQGGAANDHNHIAIERK